MIKVFEELVGIQLYFAYCKKLYLYHKCDNCTINKLFIMDNITTANACDVYLNLLKLSEDKSYK
ncbi:MAG: hypothetical protein LE179_00400 [Endomicrobium sp.]|nr:hypothetical protein [Endomicrobium sp.]